MRRVRQRMEGLRKSRYLFLAVVLLLASSIVFEVPREASAYTPHDPILIRGNSNFTAANGVTGGSGTASDPYIIEGWETKTIAIRHTDAHFIIRNVYTHSSANGIQIFRAANGIVENSTMSENYIGIYVLESENIIVRGNNISRNSIGIAVDYSTDILIAGNIALSNEDVGITIAWSTNVAVVGNTISFAVLIGINVNESTYTIHHNNFIDNLDQAGESHIAKGSWDAGYPSGGNYWSDYVGWDNCSGPAQDVCPDPDGIGDTPYVISGNIQDRYPLMEPFAPSEAPLASYTISPSKVYVGTSFVVDASSSWDQQDQIEALEVRWDWENDGKWDTDWSTDKTASHQYFLPGTYTIKLEVRDSDGFTSVTMRKVSVELLSEEAAALLCLSMAMVVSFIAIFLVTRRRGPTAREGPEEE